MPHEGTEVVYLPPGSARKLVKTGEMKIVTPYTEQHLFDVLVAKEHETLTKFFGQEILVPYPPQELFTTLLKAKEIGWSKAEAHFLPKMELKQNLDISEWTVRPNDRYWQKIKIGKVAKDTSTLPGLWVMVDGTQKPQDMDEKQMYENDPFALVLSQLRKEGKIQIPEWCRDIPVNSRFGISHDELQAHVNPAIATLLGVHPEQVRLPRAIEFNILGNIFHSEWGETDTWEWFTDTFGGGRRLLGGGSDGGGLAHVDYDVSDLRDGSIGFRPLVAFPPGVIFGDKPQ